MQFIIPLLLGLLIQFGTLAETYAQNPLQDGISWYQQRAVEADSFRAQPRYINNAIEAFEQALKREEQAEQAAAYLLKSYYFKGMYLGLTQKESKIVYDRGKELGERMLKRFPESVPIKFWYGTNAGRWADLHGFIAAATGESPRNLGENAIQLSTWIRSTRVAAVTGFWHRCTSTPRRFRW